MICGMPSFDDTHDLGGGVVATVNYAETGYARLRVIQGPSLLLELSLSHSCAQELRTHTDHGPSEAVIRALVAASDPTLDF
jgi:hypothetical protein